MTRQQLFAAFFFGVFLFLLYQFYRMFSVFLAPLTWGALLAFVFYPLYSRLTRVLRGRRGLASLILTTIVILVVMVPTVFLAILLANESVTLFQRVSETLSSGQPEQWFEHLKTAMPARAWRILAILDTWNIDLGAVAVKGADLLSGFLVSQATGIAKNIVSFVIDFFLTTFALFFFFRDGARMIEAIFHLLPMESQYKKQVLTRLHDTLSAVVQGTLVTAALLGVLAGIGFWVTDVPFAVFLGCASAFFSLLPFGAPVVWGLVALYLLLIGAIWKSLTLAIWGILVVGIVDNLIRNSHHLSLLWDPWRPASLWLFGDLFGAGGHCHSRRLHSDLRGAVPGRPLIAERPVSAQFVFDKQGVNCSILCSRCFFPRRRFMSFAAPSYRRAT